MFQDFLAELYGDKILSNADNAVCGALHELGLNSTLLSNAVMEKTGKNWKKWMENF